MGIEGFTAYPPEDRELYNRRRWWLGMTWGDLFDKAADLYPEKVGLVDNAGRWTYGELRSMVDRLAAGFLKLGLQPQDWVLVQLPNWHEFIITFFALQKIGVLTVLLIPRHSLLEINHLASLTKPVAWVVPEQYGKIDYLPIMEGVLKENSQLRQVIRVRADRPGRYLRLEDLLAQTEPTADDLGAIQALRPDPDEAAHLLPTGGTTGLPKASVRTHNSYIANVEYHARAWEITSNDTLMVVTPVGHSMALHWGIGAAFFNFAKLVLLDSTRPEDLCHKIEMEKVTAIPSVPALLARVLELEDLGGYDLSSLKKICLGGAPSSPGLLQDLAKKLECTVINGYGSSEGTNTATRPGDPPDVVLNTVGRPVCPYDTIRIVDENGNELPPGAEGELISKGPGIFTGYFQSAAENLLLFTPEGFFKTGDRAKRDSQGNITITGRIKDLINRGGEKISPAEIENLLAAHPAVLDSAVVGMPDRILGERICAYVSLQPGVKVSFEEMIAFLKGKGASLQQLPERIEFVPQLPITKVGKVDKKALREDIRRRLEENGSDVATTG